MNTFVLVSILCPCVCPCFIVKLMMMDDVLEVRSCGAEHMLCVQWTDQRPMDKGGSSDVYSLNRVYERNSATLDLHINCLNFYLMS